MVFLLREADTFLSPDLLAGILFVHLLIYIFMTLVFKLIFLTGFVK